MEKDGIGAREPETAIEVSMAAPAVLALDPVQPPIQFLSLFPFMCRSRIEHRRLVHRSNAFNVVASNQDSEKPAVLLNTTTRNAIAYREPQKMLVFKKFDYPGGLAFGVLSRTYGYEEFVAEETPRVGILVEAFVAGNLPNRGELTIGVGYRCRLR